MITRAPFRIVRFTWETRIGDNMFVSGCAATRWGARRQMARAAMS